VARTAATAAPPLLLSRYERCLSGVLLLAIAAFAGAARHLTNASLYQRVAMTYPTQAVLQVRTHQYPGPLYNHFNWGGYLIWSLPQLKVSMDGRTNVHGDQRIGRSVAIWNGDRGYLQDPELASARIVIAGVRDPLLFNLGQGGRFKVAYQDAVAVVLVATN
jgi:hypothetical protein